MQHLTTKTTVQGVYKITLGLLLYHLMKGILIATGNNLHLFTRIELQIWYQKLLNKNELFCKDVIERGPANA